MDRLLRHFVRSKKNRLNGQGRHIVLLSAVGSGRNVDSRIEAVGVFEQRRLLPFDRDKIDRHLLGEIGDHLRRNARCAEHRVNGPGAERVHRLGIGHIQDRQHVGGQPVDLQDLRRVSLCAGIRFADADLFAREIAHGRDLGVCSHNDLHSFRIQRRDRGIPANRLRVQRPVIHLIHDV